MTVTITYNNDCSYNGSTPGPLYIFTKPRAWGCYSNGSSRGMDGYVSFSFTISSTTSIKSITLTNMPFHIGWMTSSSNIDDNGNFSFDATPYERTNYIKPVSTQTGDTIYTWAQVFIYDGSKLLKNGSCSISSNSITLSVSATGLTKSTYTLKFYLPYIAVVSPISGYPYAGIDVRRSDLDAKITVEEVSYDISTSLSIDGEVNLGDGTYRINGDDERTVSYSVVADYLSSWGLYLEGTLKNMGYTPTKDTLKYKFTKIPYANTILNIIVASNSNKQSQTIKSYHVSGAPDINPVQPTYYDYIHPNTPDTSNTQSVVFTGKYYSQLTSKSSWMTYADYLGITFVSFTHTDFNADSGYIQATFKYKLTTTPGEKWVYGYFNDATYGNSPKSYACIYVCIHPSVSLSATSTTPNVGESVTITNSSSEASGVTSKYNWYTVINEVRSPISGMQGVDKSSSYTFTPSDSTQVRVIIEGYDNLHPEYDSKPSDSITISPKSPVPKPTVTYDPSTFYYADDVNLSFTEPFEPEVQISYQWYVNDSPVSGATDKEYTLENIRSATTVYVKSSYNGMSETSETVTLSPQYPPKSISTSYSPSTLYGDFTKLKVDIEVTSKHERIDFYQYVIEVRKDSSSGELVHTETIDTHDLSVSFEVPTLSPGVYNVYTGRKYTYTGTSGSIFYAYNYTNELVTYLYPVPTPSFTIITSSPAYEGQTIECSNTTTDIGIPDVSFEWIVNGVVKSTDKDKLLFIAETGVSLYTIQLRAKNGSYSASSTTKTISVTEYYDPMTRWTIVLTNGVDTHAICSRELIQENPQSLQYFTYNTFMGLKYEHRLNEVGLGSVTILFNNKQDTAAAKANNYILIYDNNYLAYVGVITSSEKRNTFGIGVSVPSEKFEKSLYDIEFAEFTRVLSYKTAQVTGVITGTVSDILMNLSPILKAGTMAYNGNYTFTIDESNVLNQVDGFCDQFNSLYRVQIMRSMINNPTIQYISRVSTSEPVVNNAKYFFYKNQDRIHFAILSKESDGVYKQESARIGGNGFVTATISTKACIAADPQVVLASSFYQDNSVLDNSPLEINSTCYDVNNDYKQEKLYGSITVSSPSTSGKNVSCKTSLYKKVNSDGNSSMFGFNIVESHDCVIVKAEMSSYGAKTGINIYVEGDYINSMYYIPVWNSAGYFLYTQIPNVTTVQQTTIVVNGIEKNVWYFPEAIDSTVYNITPDSLIGTIIRNGIYTLNKTGFPTNSDIYIGGEHITGPYSVSGTTLTINNLTTSAYGKRDKQYGHINSIPVYTSVAEEGAPIQLYPDNSLSVTCQGGLNYMQLEVLLFNLVRYNSNFTVVSSGSCALKHWTDTEYRFPYVGDHIDILDLEPDSEVIGLECRSYTINTDEMKCDFNLGMKPITIGDVVYRIKQNQMTNISN